MLWIYKSITCSEEPWIILLVTPCEGKRVDQKLLIEILEPDFKCDVTKSRNLATNLASDHYGGFQQVYY